MFIGVQNCFVFGFVLCVERHGRVNPFSYCVFVLCVNVWMLFVCSGLVLCVRGHSHCKLFSYRSSESVSFICVHRCVNGWICFCLDLFCVSMAVAIVNRVHAAVLNVCCLNVFGVFSFVC